MKRRDMEIAALAAAAISLGGMFPESGYSRPVPSIDPPATPRELTAADLEAIAKAKAKRERKARRRQEQPA